MKNREIEIERRFIDPEVINFRASESEEMILEGLPIVYESRTILVPGIAEIIHRGAATEALDRREAYLLWQHDMKMPMASYRNDTLSHTETDEGVRIVADCSKTTWGREGYEAVKNGVITKMSFAFRVLKQEWEEVRNPDGSIIHVRHIHKFERFLDYSPVTFPAYNDTEIAKRNLEEYRQSLTPEFNPYAANARTRRLRLTGYNF